MTNSTHTGEGRGATNAKDGKTLHALDHCLRHFREKFVAALPSSPSDSEDLSADLLPELTEFSSGEDVQKFLARLVVQVTKGRVSPRRAAVLGYLTNQILHSHRAIDIDDKLDNESEQIIFDLPRPKRD